MQLPDISTCPVCHDILKDAVLLNRCLHAFCNECTDTFMQLEPRICPICRAPCSKYKSDYYARGHINGCLVRCSNSGDGEPHKDRCTWTGLLADLDKHLNVCKLSAKEPALHRGASYNVGCGLQIQKQLE